MQSFMPFFPVILRIFDLECHGETSFKVAFVAVSLAFIKWRILKILSPSLF